MRWTVRCGDCLEVLSTFQASSVASVVTDPPYGLGSRTPNPAEIAAYLKGGRLDMGGDFMGAEWEFPRIAHWQAIYRVMQPGAHMLVFGGTRTWDLVSLGLRIAGFEVRDTLMWLHGRGFPKSRNISKSIDALAGAERPVVGSYRVGGNALTPTKVKGGTYATGAPPSPAGDLAITAPATSEAARWDGWGTALKPAWEPILLVRKPFGGTVTGNVLAHGTGAINVDGCRIPTDWGEPDRPNSWKRSGHTHKPEAQKIAAPPGTGINCHTAGRWPANVTFSHLEGCTDQGCEDACPVRLLDAMAGERRSGARKPGVRKGMGYGGGMGDGGPGIDASSGLASRFYFCSKASSQERRQGVKANKHATVKPIHLMRWLVRLITPPGQTVLDPWAGSGTTGCACMVEDMGFFGIELKQDNAKTARNRIAWWEIHGKEV